MHATQSIAEVEAVSLDRSRESDWDQYVLAAPDAVFSHQRGWATVVRETYGHEAHHLMAYREGRVVGVLPLVLIESRLFGRVLVSSPYMTYGGVLADDAAAEDALVALATDLAQAHKVDYLELRNRRLVGEKDTLQSKDKYFTLTADLTLDEEAFWSKVVHRSSRRNVRTAIKSGIEVVSGHEHIEAFVDIVTRNMRRLGTPAHGVRLYRNVLEYFPNTMVMMARREGRFVGGTVLVGFRETVEMPWSASLPEYFKQYPNDLLYWESLVASRRAGYRTFDFGRSKEDSGTWQFKRRYGGEPVSLAYQYYLNRRRSMPDIDPENKKFKPLIAAWRRLPMPVVRMLGPRLISAIP